MILAGLQKLSLLDYPGKLCATLFLQGCNLRCPFCHNAGLIPFDAPPFLTEAELLDFLESRKGKLEGVCITGGEPLLNKDLAKLIERIRALGFAVKLDTNGTNPDGLRKLIEGGLLDYVAMDIKHAPDKYAEACGVAVPISKIKESVDLLLSGSVPYEFRTTAVAPLHAAKDFAAIGQFIEGAAHYYIQSYIDSGDVLKSEGLFAFSAQELDNSLEYARPFVKNIALRGV